MTIQAEWSATNSAGGTALGTARRFGNIGLFKQRTYEEQRATRQKLPQPAREASPKEPSDRKRASSFLLSLSRSSLTSNRELAPHNRTRASSASRDSRSSLSGSPVWRSGSVSSSQNSLRRRHSENDRTKSSPYNSSIRFVGTTGSRDSVASQRSSDIALEQSRHNPPRVADDKDSALKRRIKEVEEAYGKLKRSNPQLNEAGIRKSAEKVAGSEASVAKQNYVVSSTIPAKSRGNLKQSIIDRLTPRSRTPERSTSNTDTSSASYPFKSATLPPPIKGLYDDSHSHPDTNRTHPGDILPTPPTSSPPARKEQEIAYHYHHPRRFRHSQDIIEKSLSKAQLRNATLKDLNNRREGRFRRANSEGYDFEARSQMPGLRADQRPRANSFHVSRSHVDQPHVLPSNPEILKLLSMDANSRRRALQYTVKRQRPPRGLVGLQNLGNTCFMNSILQCAFSTELLMGYFLSGDYKGDINPGSPMKGQLATAFAALVKEVMKSNAYRSISPSQFKRQLEHWAPQFVGYDQQDAQEFLRFMLDGLHEDLNRVQVRPRFTYKDEEADKLRDVEKARLSWNRYHAVNNSVIFDLFGGQLQSTVICHGCNHRSVTFDTFWDLSLPIPKAYARRSARYSLTPSGESCSLSECLAEFAMKEVLEEPYKCDNCKSHQKASKSLRLYRCPEVLVLHLKRFTYSYYSRDKIEANVKFPAEGLVLDEIMSDLEGRDLEVRYDLFGISNHMGGLGGGHYIAHVRNIDDEVWYEKNDTHVSLCTDGPEAGMGPSAYVLFYQRRR